MLVGVSVHLDPVRLGDVVARVGEPQGEFAVIGQQQQPGRLIIEASDRKYALPQPAHDVGNAGAPIRIIERRHDADRLVQRQIDVRLRGRDPLAVDGDEVGKRIGASAQFGDDATVDGNPPLANQLFGRAA